MSEKEGLNPEENKKEPNWPRREKLIEAVEKFEKFRLLCKYQLEIGYWSTTDFPSKHHINKILSLQYMDRDILNKVYGKGLVDRILKLVPYCKHYVLFTRDLDG